MQATTMTGKMNGIIMNPTMKANDPNNMRVEEIPRRREARPNTENLGVLKEEEGESSEIWRIKYWTSLEEEEEEEEEESVVVLELSRSRQAMVTCRIKRSAEGGR